MVLLNSGYTIILTLQLLLLLVDLVCNSFSILLGQNTIVLLVLYMVQDIALVFSIILLFVAFFSTFAFKAGLILSLIKKFSASLLIGLLYLSLTVAYQIWNLAVRWEQPIMYHWTEGLQAVYVLQKFLAVIFYYFYKRAALRLGDNKYYEDSEWMRKQLNAR